MRVSFQHSRPITGALANHEWYFGYDTLAPLVQESMEHLSEGPKGRIQSPGSLLNSHSLSIGATLKALEVGCGDQPLAPGLAKDPTFEEEGISVEVVAIDYSLTAVRGARKELRDSGVSGVNVRYETMDARHLTYPSESFDLVMDKGTIDAMLCEKGEECREQPHAMICRLIRPIRCWLPKCARHLQRIHACAE